MNKRIVSTVMCGFIALQTTAVFADDGTFAYTGAVFEEDLSDAAPAAADGEVSELITYTKKLFGIGLNYDVFDYTYTIDETANSVKYYFSWEDSESGISVNAVITDGKYISNYSKYGSDDYALGTISEEDAKAAAERFLKLVVPEEYIENVKYEKTENRNSSGAYRFIYSYDINGIPLNGGDFTVNISKINGEVIYYYAPSEAPYYYDYPEAENIISAEEAHSLYRSLCEPVFEYRDYYDRDEEKVKAFPAYYITDISSAMIDAFSGKSITEDENYDLYDAASGSSANYFDDAMAETAEEDGSYKLTEAEIASMEDKEGLLTPEEALAFAEKGIYIADKTNLTSSLEKNDDEYIWNIYINNDNTSVSIEINASTGEVIHYSNRKSVYTSDTAADYEAMLKAAEKAASAFSGDRFIETELEYEEVSYEPEEINGYRFNYIRMANGIKYRDNYLSVSFDAAGVLSGYYRNWNKDVSFPDIDGAIGIDAAYDRLFETAEPELKYIKTDSGTGLAYVFSYGGICLDKEGSRIDPYYGTPYTDEEAFAGYSDIDGSKYEDVVKLLCSNGYYIDREEFKPDEPISTEDFAEFFKLYVRKTEQGLTFGRVPGKNYNNTLTRYETAEILAYSNISSAVLEIPEIYTFQYYKDEIDREYLPCVAVCTGLGYMKGDSNDCFNGNEILTNGEAAVILYNVLSSDK